MARYAKDPDLMTALRKTLLLFVAVAALAVCAAAVAATVTHEDDSPSPEHTVRDFLLAAVSRHDGLDACRYLTGQALAHVHAIEPRGMSCEAVVSDYAHLELGGDRVDTEAAVKALDYRTEPEPGGRERVTASAGGHSLSFVLRRATQRELVEYAKPPTPWRIDAGLDALVAR
jgi:hypothetical protein